MTDFGKTTKDDPRIAEGTRVRFTNRPMEANGRVFYTDSGTGTVGSDDGTLEVPYRVQMDAPTRAYGITTKTVLADYNELEILP